MELQILDYLQNLHQPWLDQLMIAITTLGNFAMVWIVIGVLMLGAFSFRRKKSTTYTQIYRFGGDGHTTGGGEKGSSYNPGILVLLALLFSFLIVNVGMKPFFQRVRPYDINTLISLLIATPTDYSFPSGHASSSFAAATAIFLWNKKWGTAALLLALLISFSRMYLYVHFPTDILVGALIGILCGFLAKWVYHSIRGQKHRKTSKEA